MRTKLFLLLIMVCAVAKAQTVEVSGAQSGVWDADTIRITGNVKIVDSLLIAPGTTVLFDKFYSIMVADGSSLKAKGTPKDSIVFTFADTTGFHIYNSDSGGWNGFQFMKAGKVVMDYCLLQYGKAADTLDRFGGAMCFYECADVEINHTTLRCNFSREFGGAIFARGSNMKFSDCQINENKVYTYDGTNALYGAGACFQQCDVEMERMEFRDNYGPYCIGGALSLDSCSFRIDRGTFINNIGLNGGGLYLIRSHEKECLLSNLLFDGNFSGHFGGGFALLDSSPLIYNVLITNNQSEGVSCNGVFFYGHSSPVLDNCIVFGNYPSASGSVMDTTQMWAWTMDGFAPEFHNCLVEGGLKHIHNGDLISVFENVIDTDPLFVDAEHHDFRLSEGSPCRDAGNEKTPLFITNGLDLAGMPRLINDRIDIGPYEYSGASVQHNQIGLSFAKLVGNPINGQSRVELNLDKTGDAVVIVYSMSGDRVASKTIHIEGSNSMEIGDLVDRLAPGLYLIEVAVDGKVCTLKAVK